MSGDSPTALFSYTGLLRNSWMWQPLHFLNGKQGIILRLPGDKYLWFTDKYCHSEAFITKFSCFVLGITSRPLYYKHRRMCAFSMSATLSVIVNVARGKVFAHLQMIISLCLTVYNGFVLCPQNMLPVLICQ